jgi:hypothetical protein
VVLSRAGDFHFFFSANQSTERTRGTHLALSVHWQRSKPMKHFFMYRHNENLDNRKVNYQARV